MNRAVAALLALMGAVGIQAATEDDLWQIEASYGTDHTLRLIVEDGGAARASVADRTFHGASVGGQLTLIGDTPDGPEVWIAWFGGTEGGPAYLSGVIHRADGTSTGWYAVHRVSVESTGDVTPAPVTRPAPIPVPDPLPDPPSNGIGAPRAASASMKRTEPSDDAPETSFEGRWQGSFGTYTVVRDGSRLTVTGSDGTASNGRVTGPQTLVVGLRPGCCRGAITMSDMIVWQDDTVWRRVEE